MKIDKVIHSCDNNPFYMEFWPLVARVWKEKFDIEPHLIYIAEKKDLDVDLDETYGTVQRIEQLPDVPIYLQVLWCRYFFPSLELEKVSMISDIDMFPISKEYFVDQIANIDDNKYVHLNPCIDSYGTLPSCYHVAKGKKFKEVLELPDDWEKSVKMVMNSGLGSDPGAHLAGKEHWFADERYASLKVAKYPKKWDLEFVQRNGGQNGRRIDRSRWQYDPNLVRQGWYYDSHSIRPYSNFKKEVDELIGHILNE